jgi:hypothetical protein
LLWLFWRWGASGLAPPSFSPLSLPSTGAWLVQGFFLSDENVLKSDSDVGYAVL